jgi:branched-chain amino acid transport system substrate-binding protein
VVPHIAKWAVEQKAKKAYIIVADYAPGHDAETAFRAAFEKAGGTVVGVEHTPVVTLDFSPYMQRAKDAKPDVLFAFVNGGDVAPAFFREYRNGGLEAAGIKLLGTGDIVDDTMLPAEGDSAVGTVTVFPYSIAHQSTLNSSFVSEYRKIRGATSRPDLMAVSAYDGMSLLYAALQKTKGNADGAALIEGMKDAHLDSPRGPIIIDAQTRDVRQNEYIRRTQKVASVLENVEIKTITDKSQ